MVVVIHPTIWPVDTDLVYADGSSKLKLMLQRPLVRLVIQDSIEKIWATILFTDAFPDTALGNVFARDALLSAVKGHLPATHGIHTRLMGDDDYISKIIPVVRLYNIHGTNR